MEKIFKNLVLIVKNKCFMFTKALVFVMLTLSSITIVNSQSIGINTTGSTPDSKSMLDINSDNASGVKRGLLIPRMTTLQRDELSASLGVTTESLLIFNTTTKCYEAWNQTLASWSAFGCINCHRPSPVVALPAVHVTGSFFDACWSASTGSSGYYLDVSTSNTFTSFVPGYNNYYVGNVLIFRVAGLANITTYYYRLRAVNDCGITINSNSVSVTTKVPVTCTSQTEADYETVVSSLSGASRTWITRNLGAASEAISYSDTAHSAIYGCFYQFNRSQPYYDIPKDGLPCAPTFPIVPYGTTNGIDENSNWQPANDPCTIQLGGAWRLPTSLEWTTVMDNHFGINYFYGNVFLPPNDVFSSELKIYDGNWIIDWLGGVGYITTPIGNSTSGPGWWTSDQLSNTSGYLTFYAANNKTTGFPVRCLK